MVLVVVALFIGLAAAGGGGGIGSAPGVAAQPVAASLSDSTPPEPYSQRWRIGFGVDRSRGAITKYDTGPLCAGWYHDWGIQRFPPHPDGMEYVQTVRVSKNHFDLNNQAAYDWVFLNQCIDANPGSLWLIGNEPDGNPLQPSCDGLTPDTYARTYKVFYDYIRGRDPTALIGNGGIIQGSPLRLDGWLTRVWNAYKSRYGVDMPVDVWNMHNQIVWEETTGGAYIPPGCSDLANLGWKFRDVDNPTHFRDAVENMRTWMNAHGQRNKPLIISEYGLMQPEVDGYTADRVNEYMTNTFTYLMYAKSSTTGMPGDGNRLVQRWNWFALNVYFGNDYGQGQWNGTLIDAYTNLTTEFYRNFQYLACNEVHPTPTPKGTPLPGKIVREAEAGSVHGALQRRVSNSASDCRFVTVPSSGLDDTAGESNVVYTVNVPSYGNYYIWGRGYGIDWNNRKFSVAVGTQSQWLDFYPFSSWQWKRSPQPFVLNGGWNKITVGALGGRQRLDLLVVTNSGSNDPGTVSNSLKVCNPSPTATPRETNTPTITLTPTVTRTPMPTGPAGVAGSVAFQGRGAPGSAQWQSTLQVRAHLPGDPIPAYQFAADTDTNGDFALGSGIVTGTYDIAVRNAHSLTNLRAGVLLPLAGGAALNMGTLIEGDANGDNDVNISDLVLLANAYGASQGDAGFSGQTDFNADGTVGISDLVLLANNYGRSGPNLVAGDSLALASGPALNLASVRVRVDPTSGSKVVGQEFTINVYVDASPSQPVSGADVKLGFSSTYLDVVSVAQGPIPATTTFPRTTATEVWYVGAVSAANARTSPFKLFSVTFRAKAAVASTPLNITRSIPAAPDSSPYTPALVTNGTVTILAASPTPIWTRVPSPTPTATRMAGVEELVLRYGVDGYTDWWDTWIDEWYMVDNHATDETLRLRAPSVRRILIKADVSQLPPGTQITEAILTLYETDGERTITAKVYDVLRSWVADQANWNRATAFDPWATVGCEAPGSDRAANPTVEREVFGTKGTYTSYPFDFDITSVVQRWVDTPSTNKGVMFSSSSSSALEFTFGSADNKVEALRPKLTIRYTSGGPITPTPTATATPQGGAGAIYGRVFVDQNGDLLPQAGEPGVAGAIVELEKVGDPLFVERESSAADGSYRFADLAPATYRAHLLVVPEGYDELDPAPWQFVVNGDEWEASFALREEGTGGYSIDIPLVWK
jgi:hypothetical protein